MSSKRYICVILAPWLLSSATLADDWTVRDSSVSVALATEAKMPNEADFKGTKLFLEGRYLMSSEQLAVSNQRMCCVLPSKPMNRPGFTGDSIS